MSEARVGFPPAYSKFWMGFHASDAKLRLFRTLFFLIFAIDAWLQISHAPRYGHLDFNVSHFPFLDGLLPLPTRPAMVAIYGLQTYLGLRIAFGAASRASYALLATVFGAGYFISQLNSYQHHYLLFLALCLVAAFPWPELQDPEEEIKEAKRRERNWIVRMLLVSMSVMYLFAVLSKMDGEWTNGSTLRMQLQEGTMRDLCETIGWKSAALLTMVTELGLAVGLHFRRSWPITLVVGIGMHTAFHIAGLKIGLFSYFMVTLYILIIPEPWIERWRRLAQPMLGRLESAAQAWKGLDSLAWPVFGVCLAAGLGLLQLLPVDAANALTYLVLAAALVDILSRRRPKAAGLRHLIACLGVLSLLHTTDALRDYYRYWGGNERRAGNTIEAIIAYEHVVSIDPDYASGRRHLGDLYKRAKRYDEALEQYEAGLAIDEEHSKLNRGAAQIYHLRGRGPQALEAATRALKKSPKDKSALQIRSYWQKELGDATR